MFQKLNNAYQILRNTNDSDMLLCEDQCNSDNGNDHAALQNISISMRENSFSVTIDINDIMFLVFLEECQTHHGVSPIDRGHSGLQFRFDYVSPDDATEHYGTISRTFMSPPPDC